MPNSASDPIIHVAAGLGRAGTARAIEVLAGAPGGPPGQRAFALDGIGEIGDRLSARGIECRQFAGDARAAAAAIRRLAPATVILHRAGRPERRWYELLDALAGAEVTTVEVNVFGWLDRGAIARGLKGIYCVSGTALAKYLRQACGGWPDAHSLAALPVLLCAGHNPLGEDDFTAGEDRAAARAALGLPAQGPIAIRTGRPDWRKWSDLAIVHGRRLLAAIPDLTLVFLSAPDNRRPIIARELGERAIVATFTADQATTRRYMSAADLMVHHARYGESFGYALAEAQAMGLPVVVQATPWGDNAQAEVVRHGETGFVASGFGELRLYVERLCADGALRARLGEAGKASMRARFSVARTWRLLDQFLGQVRAGERGLMSASTPPDSDQFACLAQGIASYAERFPLALRLAEEAPLFTRPWFWTTLAADGSRLLAARAGIQIRR